MVEYYRYELLKTTLKNEEEKIRNKTWEKNYEQSFYQLIFKTFGPLLEV